MFQYHPQPGLCQAVTINLNEVIPVRYQPVLGRNAKVTFHQLQDAVRAVGFVVEAAEQHDKSERLIRFRRGEHGKLEWENPLFHGRPLPGTIGFECTADDNFDSIIPIPLEAMKTLSSKLRAELKSLFERSRYELATQAVKRQHQA